MGIPGGAVELRLLGAVEAWVEERQLDLGPRQQRFIFAVLALKVNELVPISQVIDLTWPAAPPQTAIHAVHVRISRLRAALDQARVDRDGVEIVTHGTAYVLRADPMCVDAHLFRALVTQARADTDDGTKVTQFRRALGMWRGPPLADVAAPEMAQRLCLDLEETRLVAAEECLDAELRLGRHDRVIGELTELIEQHPFRQHLLAQLMLALYRAGRAPEALSVYRMTRRRLVEELGLDPEPRLQHLENAILRADPALELPRPVLDSPVLDSPTSGALPARVVPAQLPPDVRFFIGRTMRLAELTGLLPADGAPNTVPIVVITGAAGVGKTTLGVHWAHQVADRFRDGHLYVDLRGSVGGAPVRPVDALARLLNGLGVSPAAVPDNVDVAAGMYRSLLAGRRVLVLLDDAVSAAQVRPLLPGSVGSVGSLVLVTSRSPLADLVGGEGAYRIELDGLRPAELAVSSAGGAEPAHLARLLEAVGDYHRQLAESGWYQAAVEHNPGLEQRWRSILDSLPDQVDSLPEEIPAALAQPSGRRRRRAVTTVALASALTASVVSAPVVWRHVARPSPVPAASPIPVLGPATPSGVAYSADAAPVAPLRHSLRPSGYSVEYWWQPRRQGAIVSRVGYPLGVATLTVHDPGDYSPAARRTGQPTAVNGRRGHLLAHRDGKIGVVWEYQPRAWALLEGATISTSHSDLLYLAGQVRFGPTGAIRFPYGLSYVPDGLHLREAHQIVPSVKGEGLSRLQLAGSDGTHGAGSGLSILVIGPWDRDRLSAQGTPDLTVAGRPAWYEPDELQLIVDFGQCVVTIEGGPSGTTIPKRELLRVAEGMRLTTWSDPGTWTRNPFP
ncbi:MAG TPA: transcriptional regulator [Mycobacteriales bacterium]|nr:transcriptional regulator [Mycobacteriales bacterium]